ncbi:MAG: 8-oxo-dGTP diphosphatase MutT [Deltaproteobacteria bacterium]|nr:8-oxo-dGTP diphosphatase MutT [Deltaproteobacteria bacterium]MBW2128992.1 8-oxo-dGTP diphosphatase MutT [Deltaproteobacteria bacterium]
MKPGTPKPHLFVTAGLIWKEGRLLIARRPPGFHMAGFWEFPGGKQEPGEGLRECLKREIREELGIEVQPGAHFLTVEHEYETRKITLHVFHCTGMKGRPVSREGQEFRWVFPEDLPLYRFPPPDRTVIEALQKDSGGCTRKGGRQAVQGGKDMDEYRIKDLVRKTRSIRRYEEGAPVSLDVLRFLVDLARCSASAGNLQPLKYILSNEKTKNETIFSTLSWAAYLEDWKGPGEGERPAAYIIVLGDREITTTFGCDHGIASQSILLGAASMGLGGCIVGSVERKVLRRELSIPDRYEILHVIALGKPKETVVIEPLGPDGDIRYWRDTSGVHHVPKRSLKEIILFS